MGQDAGIPARDRGNESLLTVAKREAARRMLYSRFYRGEVLKGEYEEVVVSIKEGMDEETEGRKRKKKRKREEGGEKHQKEKTKKKKKKEKEKEKEKELEGGVA